jgi:two-component system response regulator GlrR
MSPAATHAVADRSAAPRCVRVCLNGDDDGTLAWQVRRVLDGLAGDAAAGGCMPLPLRLDDGHALPGDSAIVIELLHAADFDATCRVLAERAAAQPGLRVLAVTSGLSAAQLALLPSLGVTDFVRAPVARDELLARLAHLCPPPEAAAPAAGAPALRGLLGSSPPFLRIVQRLPQVARFDVGALLLGETGTGKEALAQAIHYLSPRAKGPWVAVNCGAIPVELLEAELFGHVKGAYTHASQSRHGLIHEAQGGTLFLDEIDSLPYGAQAKLLRFLQDKQYRPVGANHLVDADVRVVAASNRELDALVAQGAFRQDLLFRLNVLQLRLPPLRERLEDLPLLAHHFLAAAAHGFGLAPRRIAPAALQRLQQHHWPGNVRELRNVIERAVLMSAGESIGAADIDLASAPGSADAGDDESFCAAKARVVASFERGYIQQLLAACGGNITQAARAAKKNRRAFFELMRKHEIRPDAFRDAA